MQINGKVFGVVFLLTLACWAIAYALTGSQILESVFIPSTNSLRVVAQ